MDFKSLIAEIKALPALPQAYHKCCYLLEQKSTDSKALAQVVASDPSMALAVLKLVNSAFFNIPRKIERLDHAISIIGYDKFQDLILTATVVKAMKSLANDQVDMEVFWRHSVFTALVAKRLALHAYFANSERFFLTGLVHDIGQLVYFDLLPTKAIKVTEMINQYHLDTALAEERVLGFNHQQVSSQLCKNWNLPEWLEQPIFHYNKPIGTVYYEKEATIIALANDIAQQHYPGLSSLGEVIHIENSIVEDDAAWQRVNLDKSCLTEVVKEVSEQLASVIQSLVPELSCVTD